MAERSDLSTIVVRTNPVPDADATAEDFDAHRALLALIDERSATTDLPHRFERPSSTARHPLASNWAVAAAAAVAIFVLLGGAVWLVGGSGFEAAGDPPAVNTDPVAPTSPQPPSVLFSGQMTDAWNRGDMETHKAFFTEDALYDGRFIRSAVNMRISEFLMAAGWREFAEDCAQSDPTSMICTGIVADDFHGPAGLTFPFTRQVLFDESGLVSSLSNDVDLAGLEVFEAAFHDWLAGAYPDIAAKEYRLSEFLSDPEAVAEAIGVLDEFLEQSSAYPIADESPRTDETNLTGTVDGIDVYNAGEDQLQLVEWTAERFSAAGLPLPPVTHVTFLTAEECVSGATTQAVTSGSTGHVDACAPESTLGNVLFPLPTRRTMLHEFAQVWIARWVDDETQDQLMTLLDLESWMGVPWAQNGSRHAAEILMWGLMDSNVIPRLPDTSTEDLDAAFHLLTSAAAN